MTTLIAPVSPIMGLSLEPPLWPNKALADGNEASPPSTPFWATRPLQPTR